MRADASGNMLQVEPISMTGPSMVHDFAATRKYVVFMEMPVRFSWRCAVSGSEMPFKWDHDAPCRFGVMPARALTRMLNGLMCRAVSYSIL
ncbi:MAG: carotenoid oxygenase family protein [Halioglobus sp.]|nr:carotenoid oxygenase family protein [Halioglobus sp.]